MESGRPDDDGIPRRVQQFSYDSSGLLTPRTTREAQHHYQRDNSGQLNALEYKPSAAGMTLGTQEDKI